MRNIIAIVLICVFSAGCSNTKKVTETVQTKIEIQSFDTVKWKLLSIRGKKPKYDDSETPISIVFNTQAKTVNGYAGCNRFFGNFVDQGSGKIKISEIGSTKRACPTASMELEQNFLLSLAKIDSYTIANNELQLLQNQRVVFVFEKE